MWCHDFSSLVDSWNERRLKLARPIHFCSAQPQWGPYLDYSFSIYSTWSKAPGTSAFRAHVVKELYLDTELVMSVFWVETKINPSVVSHFL